jgi:hypothetical protein
MYGYDAQRGHSTASAVLQRQASAGDGGGGGDDDDDDMYALVTTVDRAVTLPPWTLRALKSIFLGLLSAGIGHTD